MSSCPCPLSHRSQQPYPTTCPASLIANASLCPRPRSPRSVIVPFAQRNAWVWPAAVRLVPTICPALLMPEARLLVPPNVPRSEIAPRSHRQPRPPPEPHAPTPWPAPCLPPTAI